uniref:FATC domain-containing protein n=1 Tax=Chlamydomonas euryale TaxID=1486919 RepID=A0A7R9YRV0_9CHLO
MLNTAEAAAEAPATSIVRSELDGGSSSGTQMGETLAPAAGSSNGGGGDASMPQPPQRQAREKELRELRDAYNQLGDANEVLNSRAVEVMRRMSDKLMGRDYAVDSGAGPAESDSVAAQVQRLVTQAISHENLCQSYIGWCPFW